MVQVLVEKGTSVEQGQPLLVMEAMKMEHTVKAPCAGVVESLSVISGAQVSDGHVLAVVSPHNQSQVCQGRASVQPVMQL